MPHSKLKVAIAEILQKEGYIASHMTEDAEVGKALVVELKYGRNRERSIAGLRRVCRTPACGSTRSRRTCRACWADL